MSKGDAASIAIIGAGVIGLTAAFELTKRGALVTVFDQVAPGEGVSGVANGAFTPHSDRDVKYKVADLLQRCVERYPAHFDALRDLTGLPIDHDQTGSLEVMLAGEDVSDAKSIWESMRQKSWPVDWLSGSEVLELEPHVNPDVTNGMFYQAESAIDVKQVLAALIAALVKLECTTRFPVTVRSVRPTSSGTVQLDADGHLLEFDGVVVCPGNGDCDVEGMAPIPLHRVAGDIMEVAGPPGQFRRCLYRGDSFITPRRDGRLLLGTTRALHRPGMDENPHSVSVENALLLLDAAAQLIPAVRSYQLRKVWKGWRPTTADELPILGTYGAPNIVLSRGYNGFGYHLALFAAEVASQLLLDPASLTLAPEEFSPTRASLWSDKYGENAAQGTPAAIELRDASQSYLDVK